MSIFYPEEWYFKNPNFVLMILECPMNLFPKIKKKIEKKKFNIYHSTLPLIEQFNHTNRHSYMGLISLSQSHGDHMPHFACLEQLG